MAYRFAIDLPGEPSPEVLTALVEAAAVANTLWYLDQWRMGLDPPCCCGCAGLLWLPDELATRSLLVALPHAFAQKTVSCHTAAAVSVGHERAVDVRNGLPWDLAAQRHSVELHQTGPKLWHAYMRTLGKLEDPAAEMERAA